ncbi:9123_t:CDS:2, partial [Acaulospora colombiana]
MAKLGFQTPAGERGGNDINVEPCRPACKLVTPTVFTARANQAYPYHLLTDEDGRVYWRE